MAKLAISQGPAPAVPRRFLRSAPVWGLVAGGLLAIDGDAALVSRWSGSTLALVHALTLGVLGNVMIGSLLQFLPVAAGVPVCGGHRAALAVHGLLNIGALLLVAAFRWPMRLSPQWGGLLAATAFVVLAVLVLPGLRAAAGQRFLRRGIGGAIAAGVVAATLGLLLALALSERATLPLAPLTDAHASWGLLGWVLGLLAAVARVVMPMFQGTAVLPARAQVAWLAGVLVLLLVALGLALRGIALPGLRISGGLLVLVFGLAGLWLQGSAAALRRTPLTAFWTAGFAVLVLAAGLLLTGGEMNGLRAGALGLGVGLTLLVTGMHLEIAAFLGWIDLQRRCGRGVHLPGVQLLLPARDKSGVLALHLLAALALGSALRRPTLAAVAGCAVALAHAATLATLFGIDWRARRFQAGSGAGR